MALNVDLSSRGGSNGGGTGTPAVVGGVDVADPHALVTQALLQHHGGLDEQLQLQQQQQSGGGVRPSNAVEQALLTVDERVHGGVSWREALLKLRTMFPGAGNFSGFGVAIEEDTDSAFFQRLLQMRKDLQKVEAIQTERFQHNMLEQMAAAEPTMHMRSSTTPAKKSFAEWKADRQAESDRNDQAAQQAYFESKHHKPVGTDVYASNLKKLLELDRAEAEAEAALNKSHPAKILTKKS